MSDTGRQTNATRLGFYAATATIILAATFFTVGILTPVRSVSYPYVNGLAQYVPGDYYWMIPGFLLAPVFVVLMSSIHSYAPEKKRVFSQLGLSFGIVYAAINCTDYFIQFAVVEPSILKGETASLTLFTEYNPHGVFIAAESLGYLVMTVAFLFVAGVFSQGRIEKVLRWLLVSGFLAAVGSFLSLSLLGYDIVTFEVAVITIDSVVLIASGALLSLLFRRVGASAGT
jgi:hypothetical protein